MVQAVVDIRDDVTYEGDSQGAILVHPGGRLVIGGTHTGGVVVYGQGELVIRGHLRGGLHIFPGGRCVIETGGTHDGELRNERHVSVGERSWPVADRLESALVRRAKDVVLRQIRRWQRAKLIAAGGAPASWYDDAYRGAVDEYTVHYSQSRYLPVWEAIVKRIPASASVLEVGCGPAQFAQMLFDLGMPGDYTGFDFSPAAIELAKRNLPGRRVEVADARTTDLFTSVDYDTIVCTEVLEHILDDVLVLERIPKGKQVLATVPNFDYDSHVRFFANAGEVRARYGMLFESLDVTEHHHAGDHDGSRGVFFLLNGVR